MKHTQIPNNLFNGEMKKMRDTELRIVLIVMRKTLGWIESPGTKKRKKEDWIAFGQLTKFSGRTRKAISAAIDTCVKNKWIEARNKKGDILDTPQKRMIGRGGKIFYRLGKVFSSKIKREKDTPFMIKGVKNSIKGVKRKVLNLRSTKETSIQKKPIQKENTYIKIFNFWKSKKINKEKMLNDKSKNAIKEKLKEGYKLKEIKKSINNYSIIINSDLYFFHFRWTLEHFLKKGFEQFLNKEIAIKNYKKHLSDEEEFELAKKNDTNRK